MSAYRNVTFDEIEVGATAGARRALTQTEIEALVLVSGDIEPFHVEDAGATATGLLAVDAVGVSAVISGLLERKLPGPGTRTPLRGGPARPGVRRVAAGRAPVRRR